MERKWFMFLCKSLVGKEPAAKQCNALSLDNGLDNENTETTKFFTVIASTISAFLRYHNTF